MKKLKLVKIKIGDIEIDCQQEETLTIEGTNEPYKKITIEDCFKFLRIHDHYEMAYKSNSYGETFHLLQYYDLCLLISNNNININIFKEWFDYTIEYVNNNWKRPISIYQHVYKEFLKYYNNEHKN